MAKANTTPAPSAASVSTMYAASISLNAYWVLIFFKHSFKGFSDALNWYPPVGPLMALFILGLAVFVVSCWLLGRYFADVSDSELKRQQRLAAQTLIISTVLSF